MFADFSTNRILKVYALVLALVVGAYATFPAAENIFYNVPEYAFKAKKIFESAVYEMEFAMSGTFGNGREISSPASATGGIDGNNRSEIKFAKSVPVLLYHGLVDKGDGSNILLDDFKKQMFSLKRAGYETISIKDFYEFLKGKKNVPEKSFVLTFDDGRKDSYYPADPILKALHYRAVMYAITAYSLQDINTKYYLSKEDLLEMARSGRWEIQPHTHAGHDLYKVSPDGKHGHFYSNKLWLSNLNRFETDREFSERTNNDFLEAKNLLEKTLGTEAISMAFPFGDFGRSDNNFPEAEKIVLGQTGKIFPLAFYQTWPESGFIANLPEGDTFLAKRIYVKPNWTPEFLTGILEASREKELPYSVEFKEGMNDWVRSWGKLSIKDGQMETGADDATTGSLVVLEGTAGMDDYKFFIGGKWISGKSVSVIARYKDKTNYVSCDFYDDAVKINQRVNGEATLMAESKTGRVKKDDFKAGIAVIGNSVNCFINDFLVLWSSGVDASLKKGGVGIKTGDSFVGGSLLNISEAKIESLNQ